MLRSLGALFGGRSSSSQGQGRGSSDSRGSSSPYPSNLGGRSGDSSYPPRDGTGGGSVVVPRVKHSLVRIETLIRRINPELLDILNYPATSKQISELQGILRDYLIPKDVLEAYGIHDGQDSYSVPRSGENEETEGNTGFIYGLWWMSIEEVIEEYQFWRRLDISTPPSPVASKKRNAKGKGKQYTHTAKAPSTDAFLFGSEMDPRTVRGRMRSCPEGYVKEEYSHPAWLPLLKDGYGNYIGIDLDPPSIPSEMAEQAQMGTERILPGRGQVIAFGREVDTKTVLWNGWADSNAYDNLGGGGWARFLASFADDLSSASTLHTDARARLNNDEYTPRETDESEEEAYRSSQGGRQEATSSSRAGQGLEWIDASPLYSGMGTIEALVERSKRQWARMGLYDLEQGDEDADTETDGGTETSGAVQGYYPEQLKGGIERQHRPAPLHLGGGNDDDGFVDSPLGPSLNQASGIPLPMSAPGTARSADTRASISSETPLGRGLGDGFVDVPSSAFGEEGSSGMKAPLSPEPSLILSPPSPKGNHETFQAFTPSSPPRESSTLPSNPNTPLASASSQQPPRRPSLPPSPTIGGNLASPSRISPNQLARQEDRERQRTLSNGSTNSRSMMLNGASGGSSGAQGRTTKRSSKAPPPATPLGLPTLEFGNGIWVHGDTDVAEINEEPGAYSPNEFAMSSSTFEVVVDRR